jgi:SpoVK/Ycf46/Vps4 family AAA+-type ATPase
MTNANDDVHTNYIRFLDNFKQTKSIQYHEILNIINKSNIYYTLFIGNNPHLVNPKLQIKVNDPPNYDLWQQKYDISHLLNEPPQLKTPTPREVITPPPPPVVDEKEKKEEKGEEKEEAIPATIKQKITIEDTIENVSDLLKVLDKYKVDDTIEYNVDFVKLHKIKPELEELHKMVGMEELKTSIVDQLFYFLQDLHISKIGGDFKHTVIYGPPGTGKTEIAKIIGRMFSKIGILKNNVFKKVVRNDLVAGYLGQTAIKTKNIINECLGGVLFIDEAYSLALNTNIDSYSQECIDTLCEALSDHKDDLMVIIAGYEDEMNNIFFKANKGLNSRFIWRFKINNYSSKELFQIYQNKVNEVEWCFETQCDAKSFETWFESKKGNFVHFGRDMEILFLYTKICHAKRIYGKSPEFRKKISMVDLDAGFKMFVKNTPKKETLKYPHLYL